MAPAACTIARKAARPSPLIAPPLLLHPWGARDPAARGGDRGAQVASRRGRQIGCCCAPPPTGRRGQGGPGCTG
eukprot:CAMPEP_0173431684 /NCGR_PEP_ID=MMETSP1357-20121228/9750_1 /TAXON_ID=77926 /ORGANISM="Hemiselmis rufescens, Strain PCC563" /LENGTH=73 /DNA_ID=CAMNT_0014396191 /DNA_START=39 /DNA_END=256 /DNA_ORIENTATION=+